MRNRELAVAPEVGLVPRIEYVGSGTIFGLPEATDEMDAYKIVADVKNIGGEKVSGQSEGPPGGGQ